MSEHPANMPMPIYPSLYSITFTNETMVSFTYLLFYIRLKLGYTHKSLAQVSPEIKLVLVLFCSTQ